MICITLRMTVKPGRIEDLLDTMRRLIQEVRKEPGNRAYFFHRVPGTDNEFGFYEQYVDQAALLAHREHIARYGIDMNNLTELLAAPPQRQVLELFGG